MTSAGQETTREPTPQRRQTARQEGHVARSHDLSAAFVCLAAVVALLLNGPLLLRSMSELLRENLSQVRVTADDVGTQVMYGRQLGWEILRMLGPWLLFVCLAAFGIQIAQTGWLWVPQKLAPNFERLAPGRGLQRLLEPAQIIRLLTLMVRLIGVLVLAGWLLWRQLPDVILLAELPTADLLKVGATLLMRMTLWIGLGLVLLGIVDYAWQRWRYERELCMAPEDWRENVKSVHNDVTSLQRRRARRSADFIPAVDPELDRHAKHRAGDRRPIARDHASGSR